LPDTASAALRKLGWRFYNFIGQGGCRLMCSWDTAEEDVHSFVRDLKAHLPAG
jgi:threonine aldolase